MWRPPLPVERPEASTVIARVSGMAGRCGRIARAALGAGIVLPLLAGGAWSGTTGKIAGRVVDAKKQPLPGVNVAIAALRLGAATDADGRFVIQQVPAGTWSVRFNLLGYRPVMLQGVLVSADNAATADAQLEEAPIDVQEIVVSAKRPVVDLKLTSRLVSVHAAEIAKLPVQDLQEIVNLQAGVVDGHFLGGRTGEVQYQVDGVSVNNPYDNSNSLKIDRSLIEEVQVVSGTFDAEYGQAMSGVVNAVLKRGTDQFEWNAEVYNGAYYYDGSRRRDVVIDSTGAHTVADFKLHAAGIQNFQVNASGPIRLGKTNYLVSARRYNGEDATYGTRYYTPWYRVPTLAKLFSLDGDREEMPLGWSREWSGLAKVSNRPTSALELSYQAIFNWTDRQSANFAYVFNPDGQAPEHTRSVVHGLDVSRTLSKSTILNASFRQNYFTKRQMKYDDVYDPRYDLAGPPTGIDGPPYIEGVDFTRTEQTTDALVFKSTLTSQFRQNQQAKFGLEYQWPRVQFGSPGSLTYVVDKKTGRNILVRHIDKPPNYPGVQEFRPYITNAYAQDDLEWNDVHLRAGLRLEYFNPRATIPSDLSNPANTIQGVPSSTPRPTTRKLSLAPRIGVSYPVTRTSAVYFAYAHTYQMPELGKMYDKADYAILSGLQAGSIDYNALGNPDIKPERTVQYQFGYKQSITDDFGIEANMFYKDIRDLLGVEFVDLYNGATYVRLTNVDFGSVIGGTLSITRRDKWVTTALDYTWQLAQGNASDPTETATRAKAGEDPRPRSVPFNWDQRHTLNLTATVGRPDLYSVSSIVRVASGQPYTPATATGFGHGLETNSGRKPASVVVDLRGERNFALAGAHFTAFTRAFNIFDQRFFNGSVFETSGSPFYSRFPSKDGFALANPTRFYAPRRIELGFRLSSPEAR